MKKNLFYSAALLALSGCATVFDGVTQKITVNTNPPGADCALSRNSATVGHIAATPGSVTIEKTKDDITIICSKPGYQQATYLNHSGVAGATYGNIVGGLLGAAAWGVDSSMGADNKYDSPVNLTLVPAQPVDMQSQTIQTSPVLAPQQPIAVQPLVPLPQSPTQ